MNGLKIIFILNLLVPNYLWADGTTPPQGGSDYASRLRAAVQDVSPTQPASSTLSNYEFVPVEGPAENQSTQTPRLMRFKPDPSLEMATIENRSSNPESGIDISAMDAAFIPGSSDGDDIKRHNTLRNSEVSLSAACTEIVDEVKSFCEESLAESSVNNMIVRHESSLLANQGIHDKIAGIIAKHAAKGLATTAAAALSVIQEGKIKKSIKKIKNQQQAAKVEAFQQNPVLVEFCKAQPGHPKCKAQGPLVKPKDTAFAGFNGININTGAADSSIGRGPASEQDPTQSNGTNTGPAASVKSPLITDAATSAKKSGALSDKIAAAKTGTQATTSRGGGGGGGGGGGSAPGLGPNNYAAAPSAPYVPKNDQVQYGDGFAGKAGYSGTGGGGSRPAASNANPFNGLFNGKTGTGTETFDSARGPASQIGDNSKSIWDRVQGRYQKVVEEKRIDVPQAQ